MKMLPLNVVYRLYKAEAGDTIDNTYVRLTGGWMTNDNRYADVNGVFNSSPTYLFTFKDLSDGVYYQASQGASKAIVPEYPSQSWYYEPFTRNTLDPFPVNTCQYSTIAVSVSELTEPLQP